MFANGGNAVDAALATAITLTVVEPTMNGIGGDLFAIVHDGSAIHGLNATGRSPQAVDVDRLRSLDEIPDVGWDSVTVPGQVAGWADLHVKFGKLPFEQLFEPAIRYARNGFLVTPVIAEIWAPQVARLEHQPGFAENFLLDGRAPRAGEHFVCRDQAKTLSQIAETKGASFYTGELADKILAQASAEGSAMRADDLGSGSTSRHTTTTLPSVSIARLRRPRSALLTSPPMLLTSTLWRPHPKSFSTRRVWTSSRCPSTSTASLRPVRASPVTTARCILPLPIKTA